MLEQRPFYMEKECYNSWLSTISTYIQQYQCLDIYYCTNIVTLDTIIIIIHEYVNKEFCLLSIVENKNMFPFHFIFILNFILTTPSEMLWSGVVSPVSRWSSGMAVFVFSSIYWLMFIFESAIKSYKPLWHNLFLYKGQQNVLF